MCLLLLPSLPLGLLPMKSRPLVYDVLPQYYALKNVRSIRLFG